MSTSKTEGKVERKYALTRIGTGDYLLPSNDATAIYRIASYTDGPSFGLDDWPRDRTLWGVHKWTGSREAVDVEWGCNCWECVDDGHATRREAIDAALSR